MSSSPNRLQNVIIALVAIVLSSFIFFSFQTQANSVSLETQAQKSLPLTIALSNNKPTLTEFYANWCTTCQAMAKDLATVKKKYADSVNFVMLNIDNDKWLPEVLRYRVDGIPHFVFFNAQGETVAQTIGEQPLSILEANLDALIASIPLPYANVNGVSSPLPSTLELNPVKQSDPRSHGGQVD